MPSALCDERIRNRSWPAALSPSLCVGPGLRYHVGEAKAYTDCEVLMVNPKARLTDVLPLFPSSPHDLALTYG